MHLEICTNFGYSGCSKNCRCEIFITCLGLIVDPIRQECCTVWVLVFNSAFDSSTNMKDYGNFWEIIWDLCGIFRNGFWCQYQQCWIYNVLEVQFPEIIFLEHVKLCWTLLKKQTSYTTILISCVLKELKICWKSQDHTLLVSAKLVR